jgi:metal-responsive CopG/Arc/MetJ family transcriptional regulator
MRGKREQISHTIPPALLAKIDAVAETKGMTRAGLINLAISDYLDK